jgi:hypothetical protein
VLPTSHQRDSRGHLLDGAQQIFGAKWVFGVVSLIFLGNYIKELDVIVC